MKDKEWLELICFIAFAVCIWLFQMWIKYEFWRNVLK